MSASFSNLPLKPATCESSSKRKRSKEADVQRKKPFIAPQSESVHCLTDDVQDVQDRETGDTCNPDDQFTEVQRNLICDYIANLAILPEINDSLNRNNLAQSIINLPRAEAVFDDYQTKKKTGPCFEGTRVALLREMADWVTSSDESRMYVLSGLAGIGKSTVAYTIASRAANLNLLGASFFFSRDETDRKNAKRFFTTIAYQLCVYSETFAKVIGDVLQTQCGSAALTKGPLEQLQALMIEPLWNTIQSRARPILVVVDALDECDEEDALSVLKGLQCLVQALPSFKVIVTTRPQPRLDHFFDSHSGHKIFRLQDIEDKVVDGDIRLYLKHCLSLEQVQKSLPTRRWSANDDEIDFLVRAAGRLFIIASTVVRIILNKASNPAIQMQKLLASFSQDRMPFKDLNQFYTIILRNAVPADCDDEMVNNYQSIVGTVIFIQHRLPITTLAHITHVDVEDVRAVLVNLQSVILLDDDDIPRIYHKSFPDYITDPKLCQDSNLRINPMISNMWITIRYFQIMGQHLKYNISGLGTPARFMNTKDGLTKDGITDSQLEQNIPLQLQYACVYWANHFAVANIEDVNVMKELEQFVDKHMLHWFEALSLIRKLDSAHHAIRVVLKVLKPTFSDLHQLLSDGLRFISKFYATIERSALHTYYSALPCTPTDSLFYHRYIKEAAHNVCDIEGGPEKWDVLVVILNHGKNAYDIKFSLDSTLLVSLSKRTLKVWDAASGTPISTMSGDRDGFAVTNDFSTVASFKGNTITLHDVNGSKRGTTFTTPSKIFTVAISSESTRIATIVSNEALFLWDSGSGELIASDPHPPPHPDPDPDPDPNSDLEDLYLAQDQHSYWVWSQAWNRRLTFSATGARLAYPSVDGAFVHLRNGIDGSLIADLNCGSVLHCFAFSADGSRIATLSYSGLKLWSCEDGELVGIALNTDYSLAISANGSLLATRDGRKVMLWSGSSGNCLQCLEVVDPHCPISAMAFALDDTLAISTQDGIKLYNVRNRSFVSTPPIPQSSVLAFSPDSTRLAAKAGGTIYLCNIREIEASSPPSNKQTRGEVTALALSQDCSRVACGFEDGAVELWETDTLAKQPIATQTYHSEWIMKLGWSPDGRRFASLSCDRTINLWDGGSGAFCGALRGLRTSFPGFSSAMELSNTVLAVAGNMGLFLWDLQTLDHIHAFHGFFEAHLSFSVNGTLLAAIRRDIPNNPEQAATLQTIIFNVPKCTIISMFNTHNHAMAFLPDNSQLVVQQFDNSILTFDLGGEKLARGPTLEHFMQLRNVPFCCGVPVSIKDNNGQCYLDALYSQQDDHHIPVLWIPREFHVSATTEGRCMIALGCASGRIILLRLHNTLLR